MRHLPTLAASVLALALAACGEAPLHPEPLAAAHDVTASSTLTVTSLFCEDLGGGGLYYNETTCRGEVSGGTGGNTYHWDVIVNSQTDGPDWSVIEGVCTDSYPVTFTVTDSSGATASHSETFFCSASSGGDGGEIP